MIDYKKYRYKDEDDLNRDFRVACLEKNLELIDFLLHSPKIKRHANMNADEDENFKNLMNQLDINQFVRNSYHSSLRSVGIRTKKLSEGLEPHNDFLVIDYLLLEKNMQVSPSLHEWLEETCPTQHYEHITEVLKARELHKALNQSLAPSNASSKKLKL